MNLALIALPIMLIIGVGVGVFRGIRVSGPRLFCDTPLSYVFPIFCECCVCVFVAGVIWFVGCLIAYGALT